MSGLRGRHRYILSALRAVVDGSRIVLSDGLAHHGKRTIRSAACAVFADSKRETHEAFAAWAEPGAGNNDHGSLIEDARGCGHRIVCRGISFIPKRSSGSGGGVDTFVPNRVRDSLGGLF